MGYMENISLICNTKLNNVIHSILLFCILMDALKIEAWIKKKKLLKKEQCRKYGQVKIDHICGLCIFSPFMYVWIEHINFRDQEKSRFVNLRAWGKVIQSPYISI